MYAWAYTQWICNRNSALLLPFNRCDFVRFASELLKLKVFGLGMLTSWPHTLAHKLSITEFCIWNTDWFVVVGAWCVCFFSVLISIAAFDFRAFVFILSVSVYLSLSLPLSLIRSSPSAVSNEIFDNSFEIFGGFLQRINQTIVVNNYVEMEYFQIGKMRIVFRWVQLNIPDFITLVRSMHKVFFIFHHFQMQTPIFFYNDFFFCSFLQVSTINEELYRWYLQRLTATN